MSRSICFIFALILFSFPILAQDTETLPFFYTYWYEPGDLDFHVVDALTGEALYSFESDGIDCPISLAEGGEWLVYNVADENLLQNLSTGEIFELEDGYIQTVFWNLDNDLVAFLYGYDTGETGLQLYELSSGSQLLSTMIDETNLSSLAIQFDGTELLYASIGYYDTAIEFHRLSAEFDEEISVPINSHEDWGRLLFSPNGRYLLGVGTDQSINLMDLADGTQSSIGQALALNGLYWMPDADATIAYFSYDEAGSIHIGSYTVDSQDDEDIAQGDDAEGLLYFSLSPDGSFALYALQVEEFDYDWFVIDTNNDESQFVSSGTNVVVWLSGSQFVYDGFNTENESIDLYFYDATTGESSQVTDTADRYEQFICIEG